MSLVDNDKYYIPFNKSQILDLPLEQMTPYEISLYSIEKCFLINGKMVKKNELYPIIEFKSKDKEKIESLNYSKNYIPFKKGHIELNNEFYSFHRNKINMLIFMLDNEIKINDMHKLLFYIINNCPDKKNSISITVILCSLDFCEFRPFFLLHDKPYHFYDDYIYKNKDEYDKFIKRINSIYKMYTINLLKINKFDIFESQSLHIYPALLPIFIIYDKNYRILYKNNLFQETPESLEEICKLIYEKIENPFSDMKFKSLMKPWPFKVKTFFDKIEKNIKANKIFKSEIEYENEKEKIIKILREETSKEQNKGKFCKVYFTKKIQSLTKEQLESLNDSNLKEIINCDNIKSIYLKPIISINNENALLSSFMINEDVIFPKKFGDNVNIILYHSWKCIQSFCKNNDLNNYEIQFKSIKNYNNIIFKDKKELNVIYQNGLDYYYIPMNYRTLFMDKTKYYNINLKPNLIINQDYKVKYKDINTKTKTLEIKKDVIEIFQFFREHLYHEQANFGETIKKLREENPKIKIKYYLGILIAGDQFQNSIFYDKVKSFIETFTNVDDILFFSYVIEEFHEMTKYFTMGRNIYIFGLKNELVNVTLIPDKIEETRESLIYTVNKLLLKNYEKEINKEKYISLKEIWKDFLKIKEIRNDKILLEVELSKIKYFDDKKKTRYFFKCYNYEKKIGDDNTKNNEQIQELFDLKNKIQQILE